MTPAEVILMTRGYLMKRSKEAEQTRTIAHNIYLNRPIKGKHITNVREWWPLPSDKFHKVQLAVEDMRSTWEKLKNKR